MKTKTKKWKWILSLALTSVACFLLAFVFLGRGSIMNTVAVSAAGDVSLPSFEMYQGAQIRLPSNSNGTTYNSASIRFMATIEKADYEAFEAAYGEGAVVDTTEWGILFTTRARADAYDINAANVFGDGGTRQYHWTKDSTATWATDDICGTATGSSKAMFTPVRYDNLNALSFNQWGGLINANLSLEGQAGQAYYVIAGAIYDIPEAQYATEIVGRAYVRYSTDGGTTYKYKFADYAGGNMDNNARSMTYIAQKYLDIDAEQGNSNYKDEGVATYVTAGAAVDYVIEYHFMDADGKSFKCEVPIAADSANKITLDSVKTFTLNEIATMTNDADVIDFMRRFTAQIDWANPERVIESKAYANGRTTFKVYFSNSYGSNSFGTEYDVLYDMLQPKTVRSWYYDDTTNGHVDDSVPQYDKTYTFADDTYSLQVCEEHDSISDCQHICENKYCSSPYHGHCSQYVKTAVQNNTLQFSAFLPTGKTFASYDYVLLRFYSSVDGLTMSPIVGSETVNGTAVAKTSGHIYNIQKGWNRFEISGAAIQAAIDAYKAAGGVTVDDAANGKYATYAPYRDGQYLQFLVSEGTGETWELYVEDVVGVKARPDVTLTDGSFESTTSIKTTNFTVSQNSNASYVSAGSKSIKLVDNRPAAGDWTTVYMPLITTNGAITATQLTQMDISFDLYCTHSAVLRLATLEWKNGGKSLTPGWNKVRLNGWRISEAMMVFDIPTSSYTPYNESTGELLISLTDFTYGAGATFYIDNLQITPVESGTSIVLDEFTWTPVLLDALETPKIIQNEWVHSTITVGNNMAQSDIITQPIWYPVTGAAGYEVLVNNATYTGEIADHTAALGYYMITVKQGDSVRIRAYTTDSSGNKIYSEWDTGICTAYWKNLTENYDNFQSENSTVTLARPTVTVSGNGIPSWAAVANATVYQVQINNDYGFLPGASVTKLTWVTYYNKLNPGDTISIRACYEDTAAGQVYYGAWSYPVMYDIYQPGLDATGINDVEIGSSMDFTGSRISYENKSALCITMNKDSGTLTMPLTIGGQPITNEQLWMVDYIEFTIVTGANNNASSTFTFNGKGSTLAAGTTTTVRISGMDIYNGNTLYSNEGQNATSEAQFNIAGSKSGDTFIFSSIRIVYR